MASLNMICIEKLVLFVMFAAVVLKCVFSYNFATSLPLVKVGRNASYFGYSVTHQLVKNQGHRLIVGAPRGVYFEADKYHQVFVDLEEPGRVYQCSVTSSEECEPVELIDKDTDYSEEFWNTEVERNKAYMGFSVCGSDHAGSGLIACAHHWKKEKPGEILGIGSCVVLNDELKRERDFTPCDLPNSRTFEDYGMCQSGISCAMPDGGNTFVIGAPGSHTWRGAISKQNNRLDIETGDSNHYWSRSEDEPGYPLPPTKKYSYLGMSVAVGKLMESDELKELIYVAGAPREDYIGHVLFFRESKDDKRLEYLDRLVGEQFGSYFGYSLALSDVNGDGFIDVIVGAPFYRETHDCGAIYVYLKNKGLSFQEPQKMKNRKMNEGECTRLNCLDARFGWAVANLKDIDKDGFEDVAVSAPFEGDGVVYIFRGSKNGLIPKYSQRITSQDVAVGHLGAPKPFGASLDSRGVDVDANGYPDLVVGAFQSDRAYVIKTLPIVNLDLIFQSLPNLIDPKKDQCELDGTKKNCFELRICFQPRLNEFSSGVESTVVNYTIEAEAFSEGIVARVHFKGKSIKDGQDIQDSETINFLIPEEACKSHRLYIIPGTRDFLTPMKFRLSYEIVPRLPAYSDRTVPSFAGLAVLNSSLVVQDLKVGFINNCGEDTRCETDLVLKSKLTLEEIGDKKYKLRVTTDESMMLVVSISNKGEDAHETSLFIEVPSMIKYLGTSNADGKVSCSLKEEGDLVVCFLGNPMPANTEISFGMRFDPKTTNPSSELLPLRLFLNTTSTETDPSNNNETLEIEVLMECDLGIRGNSEPESVFFGGEIRGESAIKQEEDIGLEVKHNYEIKNVGRTRVPSSYVTISWPYELQSRHTSGKHLLYLMERPMLDGRGTCHLDPKLINPVSIPPARPNNDKSGDDSRSKRDLHLGSSDVTVLDCESRTAKCHVFNCTLEELRPGQSVVIKFRSRLWNSTFLKEFPNKDMIKIYSMAEVVIDPSLNIKQINPENDSLKIVTLVMPEALEVQTVPLWVIIASVVAGIVFLILLIIILWKCGFFKRRRMDNIATHQAVVKKGAT